MRLQSIPDYSDAQYFGSSEEAYSQHYTKLPLIIAASTAAIMAIVIFKVMLVYNIIGGILCVAMFTASAFMLTHQFGWLRYRNKAVLAGRNIISFGRTKVDKKTRTMQLRSEYQLVNYQLQEITPTKFVFLGDLIKINSAQHKIIHYGTATYTVPRIITREDEFLKIVNRG